MASPLNLQDFEDLARERLSQMTFEYFAGGANDELTLTENRAAWSRLRFRPRSLVDVGAVDVRTTLLERQVAAPILTAPCSFNRMAHPDGELGVARATAEAGLVQVLSMQATTTLEDVASVAGDRWLQLAILRDRGITQSLVERAEAAGYRALCVTVDVPVLGRRERDSRNGFRLPAGLSMVNLDPYTPVSIGDSNDQSALARFVNQLWDPSLTWEAIDWLCSITRLPVVAKGILTSEDARQAVAHGVSGVIVSNHGGRQLDGAVSTCAALPEVTAAVGDRTDVLSTAGSAEARTSCGPSPSARTRCSSADPICGPWLSMAHRASGRCSGCSGRSWSSRWVSWAGRPSRTSTARCSLRARSRFLRASGGRSTRARPASTTRHRTASWVISPRPNTWPPSELMCNGRAEPMQLLDNKGDATYPLPMTEEVKHQRRRGRTRISSKHQVTLPVDALAGAGLKVGDRLRADVSGPGQITLVREDDPLEQFAGALTGIYPEGYLDDLRREWT